MLSAKARNASQSSFVMECLPRGKVADVAVDELPNWRHFLASRPPAPRKRYTGAAPVGPELPSGWPGVFGGLVNSTGAGDQPPGVYRTAAADCSPNWETRLEPCGKESLIFLPIAYGAAVGAVPHSGLVWNASAIRFIERRRQDAVLRAAMRTTAIRLGSIRIGHQ